MFEERYKKLNQKQKEAVDTIEGPVLVVAGPGSGKTELLSLRVANILKQTDTNPSSILLLTFTESAAHNMRERLVGLIGERAYKVGIYTFHSLGTDILNKYSEYFWEGAKFIPATEVDQHFLIDSILKTLPKKNILSKFHPELGFIYQKDVLNSIKDLKKGNFTPELFEKKLIENKKYIKELKNICEPLSSIIGKRKFEEVLPAYIKIYNSLKKIKDKNDIANSYFNSLEFAINEANNQNKSTPLTSWKDENTKKQAGNLFIFNDEEEEKNEKLSGLLYVFSEYQKELYKQRLFDFEDMIVNVNVGLSKYPNLKAEIQEKYQYIMVDEFQDTNKAQFDLVVNICDSYINNGNPNLLAVGDDDQAIYKFQGAELENVNQFLEKFKSAKIITLIENYRSTQDILDFSRNIITKIGDRLETRDSSISKKIIQANKSLKNGEIITKRFVSKELEFDFISHEIKKLISSGTDPSEIAIICRKHEMLKQISEVFSQNQIPYSYEKRENVLQKENIKELILILKFLNSYNNFGGEEFLPEILSFPFFGVPHIEIWKVAEVVRNGETVDDGIKSSFKKISWLSAMEKSTNKNVKFVFDFLIYLIGISKNTPIEYLLDEIIGTTEFLWEDSEYDDTSLEPNEENLNKKHATNAPTSPYKSYYFGNTRFERNKPEYLDFLFALRTFIGALREFKTGQTLYAKDIEEFLTVYDGQNLTLSSASPFSSSENSVQLLTAHKSKGLEFEYVFLIGTNNSIWKKGGVVSKISFHSNMRLQSASDNDDDKLRLLYVALTRAKHTLYITYHNEKLEYLSSENNEDYEELSLGEKFQSIIELSKRREFVDDEKVLLKRILENYKMPVTHLNNFLNITKIGPEKFVEQNLLRFPQAITPSGAYGSAIHEAIERYFLYNFKHQKRQTLENMFDSFESALLRSHLPEVEYNKLKSDGFENLKIYFEYLKKQNILPQTKVEVKFSNEGVHIGEVLATGNIDKMEFIDNEIIVTDLKTGESFDSWSESGLSDYEKVKLHFFKYQLAYYKLLIDNSRNYSSFKTKVGRIEFVEADKNGKILSLELVLDEELVSRIEKLANIVYKKILNLDFPNTDKYAKSIKGILEFEEDLLNEKI